MNRNMKNSGIDWLEKIPEDWNIGRLKFEFTFSKGLSITKADLTDEGIPVLSYGQVHAKNNSGVALQEELLRYVPQETVIGNSISCVREHDFIFADTSEDIEGCGNCVYVDKDTELYGGYHTIVLHSKNKNDHQYLAYLFKTDAWRSQIRKQLTEVKLYSVSQSVLNSTKIVLPPETEQKEIASFLNRKCSDIDSAIARQKTLIEKLKEYKKSVITKAVTKGLNPDAKMKDSGIDWLGIIPDNWEIGRLKFEFTFSKGLSITKADLTDEGAPVLSYGQVHAKNNSGVALQEELLRYVPQETVIGHSVSCVRKHDFIFADTSEDLEGCGNCVYVNKDMELYGGYHTIVLHSKNKNNHQYLAYLFKTDAWRSQIRKQLTEVKLYTVSQSVLNSTKIVLSPETEQKEIVSFLNSKCSDIDSAIVKSENLISKLEEYKKSVIFNAVTGKMDCRNR